MYLVSHTGTKELASEYEAAKAQLEENDTYTQVFTYTALQ